MLNDKSRLVYTSRDKRFLGRSERVIEFRGKEVRGQLARRMLMTHAGFNWRDKFDAENKAAFNAVLDLCDGLPLAFGIAGASVLNTARMFPETKRENAWKDFHREIMTNKKDFLKVSAEEYGTLPKIVEMCLKVLELQNYGLPGRFQEYFRALCVLEKRQTVPLQVLQKVWNLETLSQARDIVQMFYDVSIVQIWKDDDCVQIQLHDLVLDIAIRRASDKFETQDFFRSLVRNYIPVARKEEVAETKDVQSNENNVKKSAAQEKNSVLELGKMAATKGN
eukprot:TRINITY_DN834_c0_g1_i3.p2 TRINITY_DN834_c0_g1~~TRINITY_DN834_c0_g1_i3.p2  ORF type:complete len:279 (-),score=51.40 TRINITY_DN834_c0_g1_i3:1270-2106(-)